jgi:hypothetical protein
MRHPPSELTNSDAVRADAAQEPGNGSACYYLAGLCDYSDKLTPGERGVVAIRKLPRER